MATETPTLHMFCGKIAAGKSTLAANLAQTEGAILIKEDDWLASLFGEDMTTAKDYMRCATKLRHVLGPHITDLLNKGLSVVLDFQANTVESRTWMRHILESSDAGNQLHVLMPPDEVCLTRLRARNATGDHPFTVTDAQFHQISKHFVPPTEDEGFNLIVHDQAL